MTVDMDTGEPITVGYVDEKDPQAVKCFLAFGGEFAPCPLAGRARVVTDK